MATSLNKWTAIRIALDPRLRSIKIPGTTRSVRVSRSAAPLFAAFLADWNHEIGPRLRLNTGPVDGWNYRASRLTSGLSNHSSGTAVDVRYDVLHADGQRHMTDAERKALKRILARYVTADGHHVLANGYAWNHCDEMHTELSQGWDKGNGAKRYTTAADVAEVITRLRIDKGGHRLGG